MSKRHHQTRVSSDYNFKIASRGCKLCQHMNDWIKRNVIKYKSTIHRACLWHFPLTHVAHCLITSGPSSSTPDKHTVMLPCFQYAIKSVTKFLRAVLHEDISEYFHAFPVSEESRADWFSLKHDQYDWLSQIPNQYSNS